MESELNLNHLVGLKLLVLNFFGDFGNDGWDGVFKSLDKGCDKS